MKSTPIALASLLLGIAALAFLSGCRAAKGNSTVGTAPRPSIVPYVDLSVFKVDRPEQFPVAPATMHAAASELVVTGTVSPDISRNVPVISLASGRVVAIHARLGDTVQKGQLLMSVRSDDVAGGFANYRKAVEDEILARTQLERAKDLYAHGAMALADMQAAQNAANKARIDVETMAEHLRLIGNDPDHPNAIVDIFAPASGVITDQQVTNSSGVQAFGSNNPFTISDLSNVWVVCDVYENDLPSVHVGDAAEIRLNAYPNQVLKGAVSNIGAALDPSIRTAKVRIEVHNPGLMRLGMFVTATFRAQTREARAVVPASAVLHMHDRDFVFVPTPDSRFRRVEVVSGDLLASDTTLQEIRSGLKPGAAVVTNALALDHVLAQ